MKRKLFLCLLSFLLAAPLLYSMDWPSPSGVMTKNFGFNESALPQLGISFESTGKIAAADNAELLYYRNEQDTASRLPSTLGSWTALDHGDGIISIYARLDNKMPEGAIKPEKGQVLGEAGASGWSAASGFYFQLFDRKEKRWINPSLIITPPDDTRLPEILSVRLRDSQGRLINPFQTANLNQGRYSVIVNAIDTLRTSSERPLAPHRIMCSVNGSETGVLNFENFSARDGQLMVYRNGLIPVKQVYAPSPSYEIADIWLSRGQTSLEIIAQDIAGNTRSVFYRLFIE